MSDTILITGGSSGLGLLTAQELARQGRDLLLGCRDEVKARRAADRIRAINPAVQVDISLMDISSIRSVQQAAAGIAGSARFRWRGSSVMRASRLWMVSSHRSTAMK